MMALMVLFWLGVIVLAVWLAKGLFPSQTRRTQGSLSAREILAQRYVRGEISKEEYDRMLSDLMR